MSVIFAAIATIVICLWLGYDFGYSVGHVRGWYRGYDARKYETTPGENWR